MKKPLLIMAMLLSIISFAQTTYTISTSASPYTELINATPVNFIEEGDEEEYWDDPAYFIPLEFGFEVGEATYNSLIQFGGGAEILIGDMNFEDTTLISSTGCLFGLSEDLADRAAIPGNPPSTITYNTTGSTGNRITKIQYTDAGFYEEIYESDNSADNRISFQFWFYEENGIMEIHIGESNIVDPETAFYGNPGPSIIISSGFNFNTMDAGWAATLVGDPANPTLLEAAGSLNAMPASGRVYQYTPATTNGLNNASTPEFSIYPTLAVNEIWVKDSNDANATYRIIDITGKEIQSGQLQSGNPVSVSMLNPGIYLLLIDGMNSAAKFIKE